MDIESTYMGVAGRLSNFEKRAFTFDGVKCNSMEGLLQAFKQSDSSRQKEICLMSGGEAKRMGNKDWRATQTLWWDGIAYKRQSPCYQILLDRAYDALATNGGFRTDLLSTVDAPLTHDIGGSNTRTTILTEKEFCNRLMKIRDRISHEA